MIKIIVKCQQITRNLFNFDHLSYRKCSTLVNNFKEVTIPVPWGHVAGKWWGPTHKRPILTIHGWQENCASFDRLIPLLDKNVSFLCIDMPGHGYSSRIPSGVDYNFVINCRAIRSVIEHYNWPKVTLMGHSLGGATCYGYGMIFPKTVDFSIFIEGVQPASIINKDMLWMTWRKYFNEFFKHEQQERNQIEPPNYTMEEIRQKVSAVLGNSINYEHSLLIAERNVAPSKVHPGKFCITRDPRLKSCVSFDFSNDVVEDLSYGVNFPFLVLHAKFSHKFQLRQDFYAMLDVLKRNNAIEFDFHYVEGNHHVHLNQPEIVAGLINDFIRKMDRRKCVIASS